MQKEKNRKSFVLLTSESFSQNGFLLLVLLSIVGWVREAVIKTDLLIYFWKERAVKELMEERIGEPENTRIVSVIFRSLHESNNNIKLSRLFHKTARKISTVIIIACLTEGNRFPLDQIVTVRKIIPFMAE